ncbi:uncharacterized protein B0P05DRAFT_562938 [Gilbertella persicaria]|uniref:uncharacterized protein n=1 Tax=Gilbertella persicaria TaxID=101096 RepID=UPI00221EC10F|nr:uncharacterized protein B0P05DRAFT_562938 [Gilbertella persicaria]KAI8051096.1 hypothetical protein B0P05DRAFT_562938 [Gilbertella persicaria]
MKLILEGHYEQQQDSYSSSPSESSTTRLANSPSATPKHMEPEFETDESYDYYSQDPYSPRNPNKPKKKKQYYYEDQEKRANSYLPYSHHARNPNHPVEPIYLDEDLPSFNSPNHHSRQVGSILQDNIVMDMMSDTPYAPPQDYEQKTQQGMIETLPVKKKKWWAQLGISGRKLVFAVFGFIILVALIWYFVWPRDPTLAFLDAGLKDDTTAHYTSTSMEATWSVNFTVNNMDNWIPTNIQNFAVSVIDESTGEVFGRGNTGHLSLRPRAIDQVINVPIYINITRDATNPTLRDLLNACWMINQDLTSSTPKQSLNIKFSVVYYIAGIIWHTTSVFSPQSYFQCP